MPMSVRRLSLEAEAEKHASLAAKAEERVAAAAAEADDGDAAVDEAGEGFDSFCGCSMSACCPLREERRLAFFEVL